MICLKGCFVWCCTLLTVYFSYSFFWRWCQLLCGAAGLFYTLFYSLCLGKCGVVNQIFCWGRCDKPLFSVAVDTLFCCC